MMDTRPVIILAFANSPSSPLHYLSEEIKRCNSAFNNISGKFQIRYLYEAKIEDIQNAIDETASRVVGFMVVMPMNRLLILLAMACRLLV
jgi:hypothetical protein